MKRIDALGKDSADRLGVATGGVLDAEADPVLQDIVEQVSLSLKVPIALVSLVLQRTQFFRAQIGLPIDLAVARATDRDASFCQFVVRDGQRFEVTDASVDDRVPQELVDRYGIRAYIGEPVRVDSAVLGSLCAIDLEARQFNDAERKRLAELAARASQRLTELAKMGRAADRALLAQASGPALGELRNALSPLQANIAAARIAAADLAPLLRISHRLAKVGAPEARAIAGLQQAMAAFDDLQEIVADLDTSVRRLAKLAAAFEGLLLPSAESPTLAEILGHASRLAHHQTKLVGGIAWAPISPELRVATPRLNAVAAVAAALALLADPALGKKAGLRVEARTEGATVILELSVAAADASHHARAARELASMLAHDPFLAVDEADGSLRLHLCRETE